MIYNIEQDQQNKFIIKSKILIINEKSIVMSQKEL